MEFKWLEDVTTNPTSKWGPRRAARGAWGKTSNT